MKPNVQQRQATYLLQQLFSHQEPMGGMLFFKAVQQCQLDDTPQGIERLDKMFAQMRAQGITIKKILQQPNHKNFILTIGVYLGHYIGQRIGEIPMWYSYAGFSAFTEDESIPKTFAFSLVAQFAYGISLPLGAVLEALSGDFLISDYIKDTCSNILSKSQVNLLAPPSDICNYYLKKVRTGKLIDSHMAYRHLLMPIRFDYSYKSLEQIDGVLQEIKTQERLTNHHYPEFVNDPKRQAFIIFLGCYIGMTASQLANTTVKWFNYDQMKEMLNDPDYTYCLEHNMVMMFDGGYLRMPLMAVTNYFFELNPQSSIGAKNFADNVLRDNRGELASFGLSVQSNQPLPPDWQTAAKLAGNLAAWNLVHASDGGHLSPMSIDYTPASSSINFVSHMFNDIGVEALLRQLDVPSPTSPFNFLSYDMYANLPTGRTDGIAIEIRVFSEPRLSLQLILPYRHAEHPFGFAIYPLIQGQHSPYSQAMLTALAQAFYQGAKEIKDPFLGTDFWTSYYIDRHDLFAPAAWLSQPITSFDPLTSQIELLPLEDA